MSDPFVAEIRMFGGNFAPTGWATCDGQLLPISQNTALFSLLGTFYGGNGQSTFALPDLQDSVPIFWGDGAGLSQYSLGQQSGSETVTLLVSEMPLHTHQMMAHNADPADLQAAGTNGDRSIAKSNAGPSCYQTNSSANLIQMAPQALPIAGSSFPHNNMQPFLTVTFIIAMQGVFPPRG
jgi:microcystin-dependent protein